jgi:hypothetical protein
LTIGLLTPAVVFDAEIASAATAGVMKLIHSTKLGLRRSRSGEHRSMSTGRRRWW